MYARRLASFTNWEGSVDFKLLVYAGFKYTGVRDETKCVNCHLVLENWNSTDVPLIRHQKNSPGCSIVKYLETCQHFSYSNNSSFKCCRPTKSGSCSSAPLLVQFRKPAREKLSQSEIVEHFMTSEVAQCAIDMGYAVVKVRDLAQKKVKESNQIYEKAVNLISDLLLEDESENCDAGVSVSQTQSPPRVAISFDSIVETRNMQWRNAGDHNPEIGRSFGPNLNSSLMEHAPTNDSKNNFPVDGGNMCVSPSSRVNIGNKLLKRVAKMFIRKPRK